MEGLASLDSNPFGAWLIPLWFMLGSARGAGIPMLLMNNQFSAVVILFLSVPLIDWVARHVSEMAFCPFSNTTKADSDDPAA